MVPVLHAQQLPSLTSSASFFSASSSLAFLRAAASVYVTQPHVRCVTHDADGTCYTMYVCARMDDGDRGDMHTAAHLDLGGVVHGGILQQHTETNS